MSYTSAIMTKSDRVLGRRSAPPHRASPTKGESLFPYLRNLPTYYPNGLLATDCPRRALKPQSLLLLFLALVCLIPRLLAVVRIASVCPDGIMYIRLATALEEGRFSEALAGMNLNIYPPILMFLHRTGLSWEMAGELWGVLISSLVILPMFGLFRRQFDDNVAIVCCLLYAVHPVILQWTPELIRDPTFWFFFTANLYFLWRAVTEMRWFHFFAAGMTLTLAVLTRFEGFFLLIPLVLWTVGRYRALTEKPLRRRLLAGAAVTVGAFPAIIVLVNMAWLSQRDGWVFSRLSPLKLIDYWWHGIVYPVELPPETPLEIRSLSFFRLTCIYVPALVKGLSPLFAIPMLVGIWSRRRIWGRCDHQPLFYTALVVMAAAWIHAWCAHESCDRYYLPIVLMGSPFAALGLLAICRWMLLGLERFRVQRIVCGILSAVPVGLVLLGSVAIAFSGNDNRRRAEVELGQQIQQEYGPVPKLFGSEGITPVIAHYSQGEYITLTKALIDRAVLDSAVEYRPDVILILATRRNNLQETRRLINELRDRGFQETERSQLPQGLDDVLVVLKRNKE